MSAIRTLAWKYVPHSIISTYKLFFHRKSFLREKSYIRTVVTNKPTDRDNSPLPWLSYSAIAFLDEKLNKDMSVFEYGSGMSTMYFRDRVKFIKSVEHNKGWYDNVKNGLKDSNSDIMYIPLDEDGDYCRAAQRDSEKYDIILVDGRDRINCCKQSIKSLKDSGIFIFDDSDREEYQEVFTIMEEQGFRYIRFYGLRPASCYFEATTMFYKPSINIFNI